MAVIAIDMDGTIADFTTHSFKRVKEVFDIDMSMEDAKIPHTAKLVWDRMTDSQKTYYADEREIYNDILYPGFFYDLEPFKGAVDAVKEIVKEGHEVYFLTKILEWERTPTEKAAWLKKYFHDIEYKIIMVDSVKAKHIVDADIIIDDDPRVLDGAMALPICIAQPWNEEKRDKFQIVVSSFVDVLPEIKEISNEIEDWKRKMDV